MPSYSSQPPGDAGAARCWLGQNEITKFSACKIPQNFELGFWDALSPCTSQPPPVGGTLGPWKSEIGHVGSQRLISTVHAKCGNGNRWLFLYVCTRTGQMVAIQRWPNLASVYEIFSHVMRIFLRSAFTCRGAPQMFSHLRRICVWFLFSSYGPLIERSL